MVLVRLNARIAVNLDQRLEMACAQRRMTKQAAIAEALEAWITGTPPVAAPVELPAAEDPHIEKIRAILASGDAERIAALQVLVDSLHDRLGRPRSTKRPA